MIISFRIPFAPGQTKRAGFGWVVDDYQEYAYDIYYEETTDQVYQAQGANFVTAQLGSDDWWEGDKHYRRQEELDQGSCTYTDYTLWIDDPQDRSQQVEVYLSQCEVWDHVVVQERVYDRKRWCLCDVTTLVQVSAQSEQGAGLDVRCPRLVVPAGGRPGRPSRGKSLFQGMILSIRYPPTTWPATGII